MDQSNSIGSVQREFKGEQIGCLTCGRPTLTRSGICAQCRTIPCKECGKLFRWKDVESCICSACSDKKRTLARKYAMQMGCL